MVMANDDLTMEKFRLAMDDDQFLSELRNCILNGFPEPLSKNVKIWYKQREKLSVEKGVVFLDNRLWVSATLRVKMMSSS